MSFAHVLGVLKHEGLDCLPCDRVNLDYERFAEYCDAEEHPADTPFENPPLETAKKKLSPAPAQVPSILRYFLDGSRRTYKVADVVVANHRYLPVVAGQIGVAVVGRTDDNRSVLPLRDYCRFLNVIAFPDSVGPADRDHAIRTTAIVHKSNSTRGSQMSRAASVSHVLQRRNALRALPAATAAVGAGHSGRIVTPSKTRP
jgi:hypothetical protein